MSVIYNDLATISSIQKLNSANAGITQYLGMHMHADDAAAALGDLRK